MSSAALPLRSAEAMVQVPWSVSLAFLLAASSPGAMAASTRLAASVNRNECRIVFSSKGCPGAVAGDQDERMSSRRRLDRRSQSRSTPLAEDQDDKRA